MSIVLTLTLCMNINQCNDFDFEPDVPMTLKQCEAQMPIAAGFIVGRFTNMGGVYVQRMRCRDTNQSKT